MNWDEQAFLEGVSDTLALHKRGMDIFDLDVLPFSNGQETWKFGLKGKHMALSSADNKVHVFELPNNFGKDSGASHFVGKKLEGPSIGSLVGDLSQRAQVHRSDPGSVYFTVMNGRENPTYTIRHDNGDQWRIIPKRKAGKVAKEAWEVFKLAAAEPGKQYSLVNRAFNAVFGRMPKALGRLAVQPGLHPYGAALAGLGAGAAYDLGRRAFYNTEEENEDETGLQRSARYILPALTMGGVGVIQDSFWRNSPYYKQQRGEV